MRNPLQKQLNHHFLGSDHLRSTVTPPPTCLVPLLEDLLQVPVGGEETHLGHPSLRSCEAFPTRGKKKIRCHRQRSFQKKRCIYIATRCIHTQMYIAQHYLHVASVQKRRFFSLPRLRIKNQLALVKCRSPAAERQQPFLLC